MILATNPNLSNLPIIIQRRKIVIVDGVRHEIDLYVEIDHGHSYKSIFLFECTNWKKPVGKNEVIQFSEKIDSIKAQRGFVVANSFSKYAYAQAKKDERIELVVSKHDDNLMSEFPDYHTIERLQHRIDIEAVQLGINDSEVREQRPLNIDQSVIMLNGSNYDLGEHVQAKALVVIEERLKTESTQFWPEGRHDMKYQLSEEFPDGQLTIDGLVVGELRYCISFPLVVKRPKLRYAIDIEGRGKAIQFLDTLSTGVDLTVTMARKT